MCLLPWFPRAATRPHAWTAEEGAAVVLLINNDEVDAVLRMGEAMQLLETMYQELGRGSGIYHARVDLHAPTRAELGEGVPGAHYLKTMVGSVPLFETASIRLTSDVVAWPTINGQRRREKVPAAPGNRWLGLVLLFSTANGELLAIMNDGVVQRTRVGATNGIAAKYLAREDARRAGIIGTGWQATTQLTALCTARPGIEHVKAFSPTREHREAFAEEMSEMLGVPVVAVDSAEEAVADVDVAVTSTNARQPFFDPAWLKPGMHLSCMQRDEATDEALRRADVVVVHTREMEQNHTSADFAEVEAQLGFQVRDHPLQRGVRWGDYPDLADLVSGRAPRRTDPGQITVFVNTIGVGAQFATIGRLVLQKAREQGLGKELPIDWFVESVHP